jgi:hypothetical protein
MCKSCYIHIVGVTVTLREAITSYTHAFLICATAKQKWRIVLLVISQINMVGGRIHLHVL